MTGFNPEAFIAVVPWITAKTQDHQYTTRRACAELGLERDFEAMVRFVREAPGSYSQRFGTTRGYYRYLQIGELRYWTMGFPVAATVVINRALPPGGTP